MAKRKAAATALKTAWGRTMPSSAQSPPPRSPPQKPLYLDVHDVGVIAYYNEDGVNYAEVKMHVNGVLAKGGCQMKLREDGNGKAFFWKRAVHQV